MIIELCYHCVTTDVLAAFYVKQSVKGMKTMILKQGDLVWLDFEPVLGHEQGGRRPAVVVSSDLFNRLAKMAVFCPITNTNNGFPLHIKLENTKTTGFILAEHAAALDYNVRNPEFIESLPSSLLDRLLLILVGVFNKA
jgi:mRNA interferase MazF